MTAEIICVGTELLLGDIVNTNAQFLSRELAELGISVLHQHVIGDNPGRLRDLVKEAKSRSDLLVFSGGLGPTEDDLTKETVAEAFGDTLHFDEAEWQKIVDFFARTGRGGRTPTANNRKQAMVPTKGHKLPNAHGTAPGAWFEDDGCIAVLMPGVPREMKAMWAEDIRPVLLHPLQNAAGAGGRKQHCQQGFPAVRQRKPHGSHLLQNRRERDPCDRPRRNRGGSRNGLRCPHCGVPQDFGLQCV